MGKQLFDKDIVEKMIKRIGYEILERNKDLRSVTFGGIKTRGVNIAERIAKFIMDNSGIEIKVIEIDITPYRDDIKKITDNFEKSKIDKSDIESKDIILIDDVLYTGRTIRAAMEAILTFGRPKSIQLAVIVDRGHRELPIRPDYVGKNIPTSKTQDVIVKLNEVDGVTEISLS